MSLSKKKRAVIVTGASRGLGKEIALRFGRAGDRVMVNFLSREQEATEVVEEIVRIGGEALQSRADVGIAAEVDRLMDAAEKRWGAIDVVINNAGITKDGVLLRMTEDDWDDVISTNLTGPFLCIRAAAKIMAKNRQGHIINISSIVGVQGREGQANYSASKAGLIGLTKACAKELGRFNVNVNAVLPGFLLTDMGRDGSNTLLERVIGDNALGRVSDPGEVADFIYHLSLMKNVSEQVFNLDSRVL